MKAVGIILAGGNNNRMGELSRKRAIPAMPVGGSFRCIDFVLSNMSNSHVQTVAVLTQYNSRSLNEHLSSSKWWDFGRKQGGLYLFTPTVTAENSDWYRGTADAMYQNIDFLKNRHEPYVIISSGDCVYKMDYNDLLEFHIAKKADITIACKDMPADADVSRFGVVRMNEDSRITDFEEKPLVAQSNTISTGVYIIRRRQLIEILEKSAEENRFDFVTDVLVRYRNVKRVYGYKLNSYWSNIASVDDYFRNDNTWSVQEGYQSPNLNSYLPRPLYSNKNLQTQTRYLQNAAYIRLKNLQLGYTFPTKLTARYGVQNLRIYFSGENLWTGTSLVDQFDPETISGGSGGNGYPLSRTLSCGLSVTF